MKSRKSSIEKKSTANEIQNIKQIESNSSFSLPKSTNISLIINSNSTTAREKCFKSFDTIKEEENPDLRFEREENQFKRLNLQLNFNKLQKKKISEFIRQAREKTLQTFLSTHKKVLKERLLPIFHYNHQELKNEEDEKEKSSMANNDQMKKEYGDVLVNSSKVYKLYLKIENDSLWKPSHREGATLSIVENTVILYGGICGGVVNSVVTMNSLFNKSENYQWKLENPQGNIPLEGRSGHTAVPWKKGILIFGGEKTFNKVLKMRDCFTDVRFLTLSPLEWKNLRVYGDIVEGRRNHSACIISKYMIVHGGINNYSKILNEFLAFNIEVSKWETIESNQEIAISFHTMASIFKAEIKLYSLYNPFEYKKERRIKRVKCEGIYIFGGKDGEGKCRNEIWVVTVGERPLKWTQPAIKGMPPCPRYLHSMTYFDDLNILVIYGGRVDKNPFGGKLSSFILNDIHILCLESLEWCAVSSFGIPNPRRFNHSTVRFGSKLLIFGGIDFGKTVNSDLVVIEFDQKLTRKVFNEQGRNGDRELSFEKEKYENEKLPVKRFTFRKISNENKNEESESNILSFLPIPKKGITNEILKNTSRMSLSTKQFLK